MCPKGADYQWGKDPLEQLMVRFDSWRAAWSGNWLGRILATKSTERWASNLAGRNACKARAGLESRDVDADCGYGMRSHSHPAVENLHGLRRQAADDPPESTVWFG